MKKFLQIIGSLLVMVVVSSHCLAGAAVMNAQDTAWVPEEGDFFVFDTGTNIGYLLREDMSDGVSFVIASGERKERYYDGVKYYAGTPAKEWTVKSLHYHPTGSTYGKHGKFLRLYDENGKTHYGIHTVYNEKEVFSMTDRYKSWGCVIVKDSVFSLVESAFEANENNLRVVTVNSIHEFPIQFVSLRTL
jgi:hypothetical protein